MAFEIPYDQIRELQMSLRREAGLQSYNPRDSQLPDFPTFLDAISQLDPSPDYLRCKHCKGSLIRGINSVACVFCGSQLNKDVSPDPIKLTSTSGYRWFLDSLGLDGSELVGPSIAVSQSNKGQSTSEIDLPLSDLLDLEIRWPSEPKKSEISFSEKEQVQRLSNLNVAEVDLDNFFIEAKPGHVPVSTDEQLATNKHEDGNGSNTFLGHGNLSLFENVKPLEAVAGTKNVTSGDFFSGWEANFQSSGYGTHNQEQKLSDPVVGSSSVDLSSHMDAFFESGKDLFSEKGKRNISSISNTDDWFEDPWSSSKTEIIAWDSQFEVPLSNKDQEAIGKTIDSSSTSADWIQGNQWQTINSGSGATDRIIDEGDDSNDDWNDFTSSTNAQVTSGGSNPPMISEDVDWTRGNHWQNMNHGRGAASDRILDEDDDSFDAWNDFSSSTSANVPFSNSLKHINHIGPSLEQASDINLFGGSSNPKDVDFGSVSQLDFFSTALSSQNNSAETNSVVLESFASDKMISMNGIGSSQEVDMSGNYMNVIADYETTGIERLISQMHDLSFMLGSNLSLPLKKDPKNID